MYVTGNYVIEELNQNELMSKKQKMFIELCIKLSTYLYQYLQLLGKIK